jgi:CRISPR-associated protein Csb2
VLAIRCCLLRAEFEGGLPDDPRNPEWPPSWMRLYSALVSVATDQDDVLLQALEEAPPPRIHAPEAYLVRRTAFVPTNSTVGETRHTVLFGRTNGERIWARAIPQSPDIVYLWPDLNLRSDMRERLAGLCRKVPYLGRSTSPALLELTDEIPETAPLVPEVEVPAERFILHRTLRSPFPGALAALRAAYQAKQAGEGGDAWEIGRGIGYGEELPPVGSAELVGPYSRMVIFALRRRQLDGRDAARLTHAFRRAVLSRAESHLPALHGHHDGSVVQAAFLALPSVGHKKSDGHILGIGIAIPDLPPEDLRVVARALDLDEMEVTAGALGVLTLQRVSPLEAEHAWGLRPQRWEGPAKRWVTALPMVFDRFPGRKGDIRGEIERSVVNARLPRPADIRWSKQPLVPGGVPMTPRDTLRRPNDSKLRPYCHVMIEFSEEVRGPVVFGSMRHYGLGLCVPAPR